MTLYCQTLNSLPPALMARLAPGSRATHDFEQDPVTGAEVERYSYRWRDFEINLYISKRPEIAGQLRDLIDYSAQVARAAGKVLDREYVRRIQATYLVIGYDAGPDFNEPTRFQRLEETLLSLCHATQSLLLWEGCVYDEQGNLLIG